jgi:hypothetical protein
MLSLSYLINIINNYDELFINIKNNEQRYNEYYNSNNKTCNQEIMINRLELYINNILSNILTNYVYISLSFNEKKEILENIGLDIMQINLIEEEINNINNNININNSITDNIIIKWKTQIIELCNNIILIKKYIYYRLYNFSNDMDMDTDDNIFINIILNNSLKLLKETNKRKRLT